MTLSASNIVQTNQGSTGSSNASSISVTLPAATAAGHQLIIAVTSATGIVSFLGHSILLPSGFSQDGSVDTNAPVPHLIFGSKDTTAGETSWTVLLKKPDGTAFPDAVCWFAAEISGLHAHPAIDPNTGCGAGNGASSTTLVMTNSGHDGVADEVCLAFVSAHAASGTPKTVSAIANTVTQPGTWARLGSTAVTTNTSGAKVSLDVIVVGSPSAVTMPAGWINIPGVTWGVTDPHTNWFGRDTPGGETSFTVTLASGRAVWYLAEVSGTAAMVADPTYLRPLAFELYSFVFNAVFTPTTIATSTSGSAATEGNVIAYCACVGRIASGTPPSLTGTPTHPADAGAPGWSRTGSTVATSGAAGSNVRLDVFQAFGDGLQHTWDASFTWASAMAEGGCHVGALVAFVIPPQQTNPRAALNSTM